jgi:hypothetical protein
MYERDPAVLKTPARRLNAMVRIFNAWFTLFWVLGLILVSLNLLPHSAWLPFLPVLVILGAAYFLLALIAWPAWFAIRLGIVKCPCCGLRFANPGFSFTLDQKCVNCGFDVRTASR